MQQTTSRPRTCTNGDETDVHTPWRKQLACMQRAGVAKKTKARTNRRERREGKREIRQAL
jgi:hypothetical protein